MMHVAPQARCGKGAALAAKKQCGPSLAGLRVGREKTQSPGSACALQRGLAALAA